METANWIIIIVQSVIIIIAIASVYLAQNRHVDNKFKHVDDKFDRLQDDITDVSERLGRLEGFLDGMISKQMLQTKNEA